MRSILASAREVKVHKNPADAELLCAAGTASLGVTRWVLSAFTRKRMKRFELPKFYQQVLYLSLMFSISLSNNVQAALAVYYSIGSFFPALASAPLLIHPVPFIRVYNGFPEPVFDLMLRFGGSLGRVEYIGDSAFLGVGNGGRID